MIAPDTSSRYFATDAIIARAESLTLEGACPSCQLTEASAVALLAAVCDHLYSVISEFPCFRLLFASRDLFLRVQFKVLRARTSRRARGQQIADHAGWNARAFPGDHFHPFIDDRIDLGPDMPDAVFKGWRGHRSHRFCFPHLYEPPAAGMRPVSALQLPPRSAHAARLSHVAPHGPRHRPANHTAAI